MRLHCLLLRQVMASSRDSSADSKDSKKSYDSVDSSNKFSLSDDMKKHCLKSLHCSQSKTMTLPPPKGVYSTSTSHWVRNKSLSVNAYTLFKVKRWHLIDENYLFDPFGKCHSNTVLSPANTLWRKFPGNDQAQLHSRLSLDGILSVNLQDHIKESLKALDVMLEPLDQSYHFVNGYEAITLFRNLQENSNPASVAFHTEYVELIQSLSHAIMRNSTALKGEKVPEKVYRNTFQSLVNCVKSCIGGSTKHQVHCRVDVDSCDIEKIITYVKMKDGKGRKHLLEISSKPDLYMYHRTNPVVGPQTILAVIEVKGKCNGKPVHSDDEDDEPPAISDTKESKYSLNPSLDPVAEGEDDDDEDESEIEETDLELLINETPEWLESMRKLPSDAQLAVEKFLPQLIGEMWCASRSKLMKPLRSKNGLLIGIGVVGFEIYFVTVLDSCRDSDESVVNTVSAFTNVFVTRAFHLLVKKDRRIIMKTLAASFTSHESLYLLQ